MNHITQRKCHAISISMLILLHEILDIYFGFVVIKCKFLYFVKFWNATRLETRRYGCCFGEFVVWSTGYGGSSDSTLWLKKWYWLYIILGVICMDSKLNGLKIACKRISMYGPPSARVAKYAIPRKMRGPTQSLRTHARCAGPRKVRGLRYEYRGRQVRGTARNAWSAVQLRGPHWVRGPQLRGEVSGPHCPAHAPPPHLPFNAHAMQPRFHSRGPRWAAIARHVNG